MSLLDYKHLPIVHLIRLVHSSKNTLGVLYSDKIFLFTQELPWLNNIKRISCIPEIQKLSPEHPTDDFYIALPRYSDKFKQHFHIINVPNRSYILIHSLNFYTQTSGCIGIGKSISDINKDNILDTANSFKALSMLIATYPNGFRLIIHNHN